MLPTSPGHALYSPIEVGEVSVPASVDRNSIVLSAGDGRLDIASHDQWGAPLGELIRQVLTANLTARLPPGSVLSPGGISGRSGLHVLSLNIMRFMGDTMGRVTLDVSWNVLAAGTSKVLRSGHEVIVVQAASRDVGAIVPAMSQALGQFADRVTAALLR